MRRAAVQSTVKDLLRALGWALALLLALLPDLAHAQTPAPRAASPSAGGDTAQQGAGQQGASEQGAAGQGAAGQGVPLSDEAKLSRVLSVYEGRFDECARELGQLLNPKSEDRLRDPAVIERARLHQAACLIRAGRKEEAAQPLRDALRADYNMKPPENWIFGEPVIDLFFKVREELRGEIAEAEQRKLEEARKTAAAAEAAEQRRRRRYLELVRLASQETVVERNRRWIAWVPFGVGQFQNGDDGLGYLFLTSEVALGAAAIGSMMIQLSFRDDGARPEQTDFVALNRAVHTAETVLTVSSWGLAVVAAAGIVEAHMSFVPERRTTRERPLPPSLRLTTSQRKPEEQPGGEMSLRITPLGLSLSGRF